MNVLIAPTLLLLLHAAFSDGVSISKYLGNEEWQTYKTTYGKSYNNIEDEYRRMIWEKNIKMIQEHNVQYDLGEQTYFLGVNQFTDMPHDEFREKYLRLHKPQRPIGADTFTTPPETEALPETVNWIRKGYVTDVKDQGQCGSCYAFGAIGSLEGQYKRQTGKLVNFSEQQIVDCSSSFGNDGCEGGWAGDSFQYIKVHGIETTDSYPYAFLTQAQNCKYNDRKVVTKVTGYIRIAKNNESSLAVAVATQGPISVGIDAHGMKFQLYAGGVYDNPNCTTTNLDHAVVVVGYGIDNGKNYWLVKNSWATTFGEKGYIRMSKDKNNQCGIASDALYPTL